jgi:hypothetical protein
MTAASAKPPAGFLPLVGDRRVEEGIRVLSLSGDIQGRTTGSCRPCSSTGCPGWFIGVRWETGQLMFICSQGWRWDAHSRHVRVTAGGEISARYISPAPLGTPPWPAEQWWDRERLARVAGWRTQRRNW